MNQYVEWIIEALQELVKTEWIERNKEIKDEIIGYVKDIKESLTIEHLYKDEKIKKETNDKIY